MSLSTFTRGEIVTPQIQPAPAETPQRAIVPGSFRRAVRAVVPTVGIVFALAGIAIWGHYNDWTLPKFSALVGGAPGNGQCAPGEAGWCKEHNVPGSQCIECN